MTNSFYEMRSFPDLVANLAAEGAKMYNTRQSYNGQMGYNMKLYNYQSAPYVSQVYGNCHPKQRYTPYPNRNYGGLSGGPSNGSAPSSINQSNLCPPNHLVQPSFPPGSGSFQAVSNKSLNSSLNSSGSDSGKNSTFYSNNTSGCSSPHQSNYSTDSLCTGSSNGHNSSAMNTSGPGPSLSSVLSASVPPAEQTATDREQKEAITLQISNLDGTIDEHRMHQYLLCQLEPITPVISLTIESPSLAKVKVPSAQCAKHVVANLHRKKIGHKRMVVSYIKDPSSAESSALRCQVAGLLNDVPFYSLPINRFRELFQSRFKSSINVLDLYRMQDVCTITTDKNEEKYISLQPELVDTLRNNPLVETSQHSVPYCMYHFKQKKEKGWAEQEIEPLPSVMIGITQLQALVYSLLKSHKNDIPVASILYCIEHELQAKIVPNENGVPLEHLLCCIRGVQITHNSFGIKVISWLDHELNSTKDNDDAWSVNMRYMPVSPSNEFLQQISREVVELIKMSPKSTMRFTRFIPAYHGHFGKQCRVADYGYTRLIELFEALSPVVQVMGDGENRHITLTHRTQIRRFTNDLLKILRGRPSKSLLLSQLPMMFSLAQNRLFDVTDYGVCELYDIVDGLIYSNSIVSKACNDNDLLISIVKRKQTAAEMEKTCVFAGEAVELFRKAPQFSILFKKFVRSYHYHFGYQCRLSDYGFMKLSDLLEALGGLIEMEQSNDEDRKTYLNYHVALRIFAEQVQEIISHCTGSSSTMVRLSGILNVHKNKYGYQLQPSSLGFSTMFDAMRALPYTDIFESGGDYMVVSHLDDSAFRMRTYAVCVVLIASQKDRVPVMELVRDYQQRFKECLTEKQIASMKHAVMMEMDKGSPTVTMTPLMKFVLRLVQVVKQRAPINVCDLKQTLGVSLRTCFEFGFPNLSSVINAFPDVFVANNMACIHERSYIELNRDCILAKVCVDVEDRPSTAAPLSDGGANENVKPPTVDYRLRPVLAASAGPNPVATEPAWRNHVYPPPQQSLLNPIASKGLQLPPGPPQLHHGSVGLPMQPLQPMQQFHQQQRPLLNPYYANNQTPNMDLAHWYAGTGSLSMPANGTAGFNKENNCPNVYGGVVQSQAALPSDSQAKPGLPVQGQDLLPLAFQTSCTLQPSGNENCFAALQPQSVAGSATTGRQPRRTQLWNDATNLTSLYSKRKALVELIAKNCVPPKPDTPPAMNLPFWLDPTWASSLSPLDSFSMCTDPDKLLNISIPELKTLSNLPPLDTPNILLPEKKPIFTFDQDK
ncbi:meiosis regulator and mRNA stability factor 1 [Anopheles cruzii]|uniref:meiosis regulator and mRNA stability factor 1 n=1 Tax=Anopheles cruzii TaxID=68878 RepID=UPI0022EC60C8|nr:meiosis regulator and mRNA stability factor 1 [Anopheles cruzii]